MPTEGVPTKADAPKNPPKNILLNVVVPEAMIVDENFLHRYYLDQKEYGGVMGAALAGPKLPKKCRSKASSAVSKKRMEKKENDQQKMFRLSLYGLRPNMQ